jgi:hypothetical protein
VPDYRCRRVLEDGLSGWVATALLLVLVARAAQLWIVHIGCEQTWDDGAIQLARGIHYHALGRPIYSDFRQPPYYALEYGPTIPVLESPLTGLFGSSVFACLRTGRGLTIAITLAVWLTMIALARRFSSRQAAAIAVLGFALTPVFFPTFSEFRVDMPALLLELAGLYAFSAGLDLVALILFAAAFMTKPTYVAGIAAAAGLSLQRGERWHAVRFAAGWLVIVVTSLAVIQWSNPLYLLNTMASHVPLWDPAAPPQLLGKILLAMVPLVVLALVGLRRQAPPMNLMIAYAIAAFASCGIAALRWGSDLNYFIELAAAVSILSASGLDFMLAASRSLPRPWQAAIGVVLAVILAIPALAAKKLALRSLARLELGLPAESCDTGWNPEVFRALAKTDGPILTDLPDISLRLNGPVWAPELDVLGSMRARGLFDDSYLIGLIENRKIPAIVLGPGGLDAGYRAREFFWPRLRQAIEQNYTPVRSGVQPYWLAPKH